MDVDHPVPSRVTFGILPTRTTSLVAGRPAHRVRLDRAGPTDVYVKATDGGSGRRRFSPADRSKTPTSWSADGRFLVYEQVDRRQGAWDILMISADGKGALRRRPSSGRADGVIPRRRWVAYSSDESGRQEIYVAVLPGTRGAYQVTSGGERGQDGATRERTMFFVAETNGHGGRRQNAPTFQAPRLASSSSCGDRLRRHAGWRADLFGSGRGSSSSPKTACDDRRPEKRRGD